MIALIQRVKQASVAVEDEVISSIQQGIVVLLAVEKSDDSAKADKLLHKILHYRLFSDDNDKMNLNVQEVQGSLLIISQFTLAADTQKGLRPSFTPAAPPALGRELYDYFVLQAQAKCPRVQTGSFAADMQVALVNDGPVTFYIQV